MERLIENSDQLWDGHSTVYEFPDAIYREIVDALAADGAERRDDPLRGAGGAPTP